MSGSLGESYYLRRERQKFWLEWKFREPVLGIKDMVEWQNKIKKKALEQWNEKSFFPPTYIYALYKNVEVMD